MSFGIGWATGVGRDGISLLIKKRDIQLFHLTRPAFGDGRNAGALFEKKKKNAIYTFFI